MWLVITKTGKPLTYEGAVVYFPDVVRAQQFSIKGDQIVSASIAEQWPKADVTTSD